MSVKKTSNKSVKPTKHEDVTFKMWSDSDFYGPKAQHIYFYGDVNPKNVQTFRMQLHEASKTSTKSKPLPIVIHIHSPGGDADLGLAMANFLYEVPVPVAVVVDGYACSAATPLLMASPYRVMHDFSFVLIHEIKTTFTENTIFKGVELQFHYEKMNSTYASYKQLYDKNTRIPRQQLEELLQRDIFLDASKCFKYKIVDRIIAIRKNAAHSRWEKQNMPALGSDPASWGQNANHIYSYDNHNSPSQLAKTNAAAPHPLLRVIKPMHDGQGKRSSLAPIVLHMNTYFTPHARWFDAATLLAHVYNMEAPVIGIIDSEIDILNAVPVIAAYKRYMYDSAHITTSLMFGSESKSCGRYYHDVKYNTELLRTTLKKLLKQYTKLPASILDTLFDKRVILTSKECKQYGLIDYILPTNRRHMIGGCGCSQGLAYNGQAPV